MGETTPRGRPISYSEGHLYIPRIPLLQELIPEPPAPSPILYDTGLRFSLHLTLISLFETLFFWHFVSNSENAALITLVENYAQGILTSCAALTPQQRAGFRAIVDLFINQTITDTLGNRALQGRTAYNATLLRKSWLYFAAILSLFSGLAAIGRYKQYKTKWRPLIAENVGLVAILGLYEWMFFSTVVLKYQAISMPELDSLVFDEFQQRC